MNNQKISRKTIVSPLLLTLLVAGGMVTARQAMAVTCGTTFTNPVTGAEGTSLATCVNDNVTSIDTRVSTLDSTTTSSVVSVDTRVSTLESTTTSSITSVDTRFTSSDTRVSTLESTTTSSITSVDTRFTSTDTRFTSTDTRFTSTDTRFVSTDTRFTSTDTRLTSSDTRFTSTDTRLGSVDTRFDTLVSGVDALSQEIHDVRKEARRGIAAASALIINNSPTEVGELTVDVGVAHYRGASAMGLGVGYMVSPNMIINGGVSTAGQGDTVVRGGVGWRFK